MATAIAAAYAGLAVVVVSMLVAVAGSHHFAFMPVLFWGHIAAMLAAWFLMTSGSALYALAGLWPVSVKLRRTTRVLHGVVQSAACLFALVGYACIFRNHQLMNASQFGFDPGVPMGKTVHALLGYIVIGWLLVQGLQGWSKFLGLRVGEMRHLRHGLTGQSVLVLAGINIVIVLPAMGLEPLLLYSLSAGVLAASGLAALLPSCRRASSRDSLEGVPARSTLRTGTDDDEGLSTYERLHSVE